MAPSAPQSLTSEFFWWCHGPQYCLKKNNKYIYYSWENSHFITSRLERNKYSIPLWVRVWFETSTTQDLVYQVPHKKDLHKPWMQPSNHNQDALAQNRDSSALYRSDFDTVDGKEWTNNQTILNPQGKHISQGSRFLICKHEMGPPRLNLFNWWLPKNGVLIALGLQGQLGLLKRREHGLQIDPGVFCVVTVFFMWKTLRRAIPKKKTLIHAFCHLPEELYKKTPKEKELANVGKISFFLSLQVAREVHGKALWRKYVERTDLQNSVTQSSPETC